MSAKSNREQVHYQPAQGHMDIKYSMGAISAFETSRATVNVLSHDHRRSALYLGLSVQSDVSTIQKHIPRDLRHEPEDKEWSSSKGNVWLAGDSL
jgi:hypothetical protein